MRSKPRERSQCDDNTEQIPSRSLNHDGDEEYASSSVSNNGVIQPLSCSSLLVLDEDLQDNQLGNRGNRKNKPRKVGKDYKKDAFDRSRSNSPVTRKGRRQTLPSRPQDDTRTGTNDRKKHKTRRSIGGEAFARSNNEEDGVDGTSVKPSSQIRRRSQTKSKTRRVVEEKYATNTDEERPFDRSRSKSPLIAKNKSSKKDRKKRSTRKSIGGSCARWKHDEIGVDDVSSKALCRKGRKTVTSIEPTEESYLSNNSEELNSRSRSNSPVRRKGRRQTLPSQPQDDTRAGRTKNRKKNKTRRSIGGKEVNLEEDDFNGTSSIPLNPKRNHYRTTSKTRRAKEERPFDGSRSKSPLTRRNDQLVTSQVPEDTSRSGRFKSLKRRSFRQLISSKSKSDGPENEISREIRSLKLTNEMLQKKILGMEKNIERVDEIEINVRRDIDMYLNTAGLDEETGNSSSVLKLKRKVQNLQDTLDNMEPNTSSEHESSYLAKSMLILTEKIHSVEIKIDQLQKESSARPNSLGRTLSSSLFIRNTNEGTLPEDTTTLMMISRSSQNKTSWVLGILTFSLQMTLCGLIVSTQFEASRGSSQFNIPFTVDPVVRLGQGFGILFCSSTQNDIMSSIQSLVIFWKATRWDLILLEDKDKEHDASTPPPRGTKWARLILLPNALKLLKGVSMIFVSFVVIVGSDDIIELLKVFITVMVIAETDYVVFQLAASGYLGQALYFETTRAREISFEEHFNAIESLGYWNRPMVLLTIFFGMFLGWFYIIYNQATGIYFNQKYPGCIGNFLLAKEHFGDGVCFGGPLNSLGCEFEAGDCLNFNLAYPLCKGENLTFVQNELGNNVCNSKYSTLECHFDGGDCCPLNITQRSSFGDGVCDFFGEGNNVACNYDGGDCIDYNEFCEDNSGEGDCCPFGIYDSPSFGNGICDSEANTKICAFDNGDCRDYIQDFCIDDDVGDCCPFDLVFDSNTFGDGQCDGGIANTELCKYDMGDCNDFVRTYPSCPLADASKVEGRSRIILGNDKCESGLYNSEACGYEFGDCEREQVGQDLLRFGDILGPGTSISMDVRMSADGSTIAVGLPRKTADDELSKGLLRVFRFNSAQQMWSRIDMGSMTADKSGDEFGKSVAMSQNGNRLAVSSPMYGFKGTEAGQIKVFDYDSSKSRWLQVGQIIEGVSSNDQAGHNLSMTQDGSMLAITAGGIAAAGSIQIYNLEKSGTLSPEWKKVGQQINGKDSDERIGYMYMELNSKDGTTIMFNAGTKDQFMSTRVYSFRQDRSEWYQQGSDIASPYIAFGSAAINADGNRIVLGTNSTNKNYPGGVIVYDLDDDNKKWIPISDAIHYESSAGFESNLNQEPKGDGFGRIVEMNNDGNLLAISRIDPTCMAGDRSSNVCATGIVKVFDISASNLESVRTAQEVGARKKMENSIFGLHLSFGKNKEGNTLLSISGIDLNNEDAYVKVYDLDDNF